VKKLSLVVLAFALLPAFTLIENQPTTQITLNGKPFAQGVVIQGGIIAVSVADFARAAGAPVSLEPSFQIQGNRLMAFNMSSGGDLKIRQGSNATIKLDGIKHVAGQIIAVRNGGVISNSVTMVNGKAYIPLRDVVSAFGDGSVRGYTGGTKPGTPINLYTSSNNPRGILVGL